MVKDVVISATASRLEQNTQVLNQVLQPMRGIGKGVFPYLGLLVIRLAQQDGGRGIAIKGGFDISGHY